MLQKLRETFGGWPGKVAGAILIFVFAFFGIEGYFVASNETWVAKVDGHEISQQDFQNDFNAYRQQQMHAPDNTMDAADFEKSEVKRAVLDRLVNQRLLLNANEKLGIVVPDSAVRAQIAQVPQFQVDGRFNSDAYLAMLSANSKTPQAYQDEVRAGLAVSQLPGAIVDTAFATNVDVDAFLRLRLQTRDFRYVELPPPVPSDTRVDDAEIAAYYQSHAKDFMSPEQVSLRYIELDAATMKVDTGTDEAALKARYEQDKSRFSVSEQRLVSHILIKVPPNATPAQQKAALAKAQQVDQLAKAPNADFAKLAQQYSDDLGSKNQGGDLGWIEKGVTDPAFESALFAMQKGQISDPVLSPEGYHVIDLRDVRTGQVRPFDEVRNQLAAEVAKSARENKYSDLGSKLTDAIYQDPSSLAPAAKALGLTVQTTPLFTRAGGDSGIAANKAAVKAAFSDQVLVQGNTSDPVDLGPNHIVVVHVADHVPAKPKPLADERDAIRNDILQARADAKAKQQAGALFAQLQKNGDLDAVAKSANQQVKQASAVERDAKSFDPQLLDAVFKMPRPLAGKPGSVLVPLSGGHYALVALGEVRNGDVASFPKTERDVLRTQISQAIGTQDVLGLIDVLRVKAKVETAPDRM
ncbi:MAG: SurA N-terminal domain-containing protein [Rhodanobacteraceae bacterium]